MTVNFVLKKCYGGNGTSIVRQYTNETFDTIDYIYGVYLREFYDCYEFIVIDERGRDITIDFYRLRGTYYE